MAVLLIAYDLNKETKRPPIVKTIKEKWSWAMLSESSYAIETSESPETVFNKLNHMIDENDRLYVINLRSPYRSWGKKGVNKWLDENLP